MRITKEQKKIDNIISDRGMRDQCVNHYEVLERVKSILLLPEIDCMTTQQVAEYYEVGKEAIEAIYTRHNDELLIDGMKLLKRADFLNLHHESLETLTGKTVINLSNGTTLEVPNRGLKIFPRRAILRIGMLLRDSEIAKEVRTQLLNIEEKVTPDVKTQDIKEEQGLALELGMAIASGNAEAIAIASGKMMAFKNRHIAKLEQDNKGLAGEILSWSDRNKLNAGIRKLSAVTGIPFGNLWNELYKNLQYKYGICLKQRGDKPYINWVKEEEWNNVIKTFCAMCEAYNQSPTEMFQQVMPKDALDNKKG